MPSGALSSRHAELDVCTSVEMANAVNHAGNEVVAKVWQFGCKGDWAYLWADVNAGPNTISVTNVLAWRADLNEWRSVDRGVVCRPELLPAEVYTNGCFSN